MNFMPLEAQVSAYVKDQLFMCYFSLFLTAPVVKCILD